MNQSRASRSSSPSCIWGTGKPTGAFVMIWANRNSLYGHQLENGGNDSNNRPHSSFSNTNWPYYGRDYYWHHVHRLGKLPLTKQQLSRTQQFILSWQADMFVLHRQYAIFNKVKNQFHPTLSQFYICPTTLHVSNITSRNTLSVLTTRNSQLLSSSIRKRIRI